MQQVKSQRLLAFVGCLLSAGTLLVYSRIRHHLWPWWEANGGGIPYVMFWIFLWYSIQPVPALINRICLSVVLLTCLVEIAQLWNPQPLATIRSTKLGAALLGSSFGWDDFPPYFIGGLSGWFVLRTLTNQSCQSSGT